MEQYIRPTKYKKNRNRALHTSNKPFIGIIVLVCVALYLLLPDFFIRISQTVFTPIYLYGKKMPVEVTDTDVSKEFIKLFIITRPPQTPYDQLIVTVPSISIPSDTIVYDSQNIPIGVLNQVRNESGIVTLFSSPLYETSYSIQEYVATGKGASAGGLEFFIPTGISVTAGDNVIHQKTGEVVAQVVGIEKQKDGTVQKIFAPLIINPFQIVAVYIKTETEEEKTDEKNKKEIDPKEGKQESEEVGDNESDVTNIKNGVTV